MTPTNCCLGYQGDWKQEHIDVQCRIGALSDHHARQVKRKLDDGQSWKGSHVHRVVFQTPLLLSEPENAVEGYEEGAQNRDDKPWYDTPLFSLFTLKVVPDGLRDAHKAKGKAQERMNDQSSPQGIVLCPVLE